MLMAKKRDVYTQGFQSAPGIYAGRCNRKSAANTLI